MSTEQRTSPYSVPFAALLVLVICALLVVYNRPGASIPAHWQSAWKMTQSFHTPRRALAAVAAHGHMYVIGGVDAQGHYVSTVEYAPIGANGELGPWQATSSLNQGRFYLAAVVTGRYIFALGGGSGAIGEDNRPVATVERATILDDGTLSPWTIQTGLRLPRRGLKALSIGDHIYAIGGYSGVFLKSTEHAQVQPDGTLGPWQVDPQQSLLDRYIHSVARDGRRIYLLGGHVQQADKMSYGDVESSTVRPNGFLAPWKIEKSALLIPRFIASAFTLKGHLYMLGGHNGATRLKNVEVTPIHSDGSIGHWRATTPLNVPRSAAATAVYENYVYVSGGMGNDRVLNSVEMATALANGQLGYAPP